MWLNQKRNCVITTKVHLRCPQRNWKLGCEPGNNPIEMKNRIKSNDGELVDKG